MHAIDGAGDMPETYTKLVDRLPVGEDSFCSGYAIATGQTGLTRDIFANPLWQPYHHLAATHNFRSCSSYPISTRQGKTVGSFAMYFTSIHDATLHEFNVADAVTQAAAIILSRHTEGFERTRAEASLRESEERQAFLLQLTDVLRPLGNPAEIERKACGLLGDRLGADHTYYAEINVANDYGAVRYDHVRNGAAPFVAEYRVSDLGFVVPLYQRGEPLVVNDVFTSTLIPDADRAATVASHMAWIAIPVVKDGILGGSFCIAMRGRRNWSKWETELVAETAERVWAAIERARAEQALHKSEKLLAEELAGMRLLQELSTRLIKEEDTSAFYEQIVDTAMALTQADMGSIQLFQSEKGRLKLVTWRGFHPDAAAFWKYVPADGLSSYGRALHGEVRTMIRDADHDPRVAGTEDLWFYQICGIKAMQSTPLVSRSGKIIGMFSTHWKKLHEPTEHQLGLLVLFNAIRTIADGGNFVSESV
ncbi:MAG: GAF domain-containing protein [Janthinobacterium lividum]